MHAYPDDLAALIRKQWNEPLPRENLFELPRYEQADKLPAPSVLKHLLSICYQASLLRDENRPVRFRLILRGPDRFPKDGGPPEGLHLLPFGKVLPLNPNEIRRLAAAAAFETALLGVRLGPRSSLQIWGLIHSGGQWLRTSEGSGRTFHPLPPSLVISASGPGQITASKGSLATARLLAGRLTTPVPSILQITDKGPAARKLDRLLLEELRRRSRATGPLGAPLSTPVLSLIRRQVALRIVSAMRRLGHGGMILLLPPARGHQHQFHPDTLRIRYPFAAGESRRRLLTLVLRLLHALSQDCAARFHPAHRVTWSDYLSSHHPAVRQMDDAIDELARQVAFLSAVDGAVVIQQPLELLGFGAEISGRLPDVDCVARALDPFVKRTELESTLGVGTRHRSAYRFCNSTPGGAAVVVSQDGSVRLMSKLGKWVTYSEHLSSGALHY